MFNDPSFTINTPLMLLLPSPTTVRIGNVNIPLEIDQEGSGLTLRNLSLDINKTYGHYHFKGIAKSVLPETI
jgi:hypothetical protein